VKKAGVRAGGTMFLGALLLFLSFAVISCTTKKENAQGDGSVSEQEQEQAEVPQQEVMITGGYSSVDVHSDKVSAAYQALLAYLEASMPAMKVSEPAEAYSQVVAGTNIRIVCPYSDQGSGKKGTVTAVVYFDLQDNIQVTDTQFD